MSDSVQPHRQQPTRLPHPWDSPGKNTGVGCHFLLQCMKVKSESEVPQWCPTLSDPHGLQPTRLLHPWDFPGKSTGVGCHCLLQSSLPAGFPNKVAVPWPRTSSLDLLACCVCKQYELGLHNTTLALPTLSLSLIIQVSIYPAPPRPDKAKIRSSGRKTVSRAASEPSCQLLQQNKNPVGARP